MDIWHAWVVTGILLVVVEMFTAGFVAAAALVSGQSSASAATVITRDNVLTEINALVYFQITDPRRAVYEIANLPDAIEKLTQTTLRNVIGEMDLDETLSSRDTVAGIRELFDDAAGRRS